jgi:hypothetical protein
MKLVTVATHSDGYFPWLLKSCKRFNADLRVLGWGEKWKGFTWRLYLMIKYLKTLPHDEIVCFIDGYDVILLKSLDELEQKYIKIHNETSCKIAVAHEQLASTLHKVATIYTFGTCKQHNVNAGTYIGYVGDVLDVLSDMYKANPTFDSDDQQLLINYCKNNPNAFYIDTEHILFFTLVNSLGLINNKKHQIDNACILHAPGSTNIISTIKSLNYPVTDDEQKMLEMYHRKALKDKIFYYLKLFKQYYVLIPLTVVIMIVIIYKTTKYTFY